MSAQSVTEMEKHLKARDMLYALSNHPALTTPGSNNFQSYMNIEIDQVCKRGYRKPYEGDIQIRYTETNYQKYKKEFDKELSHYSEEELKTQKIFISVYVPYERVYGEKWTPDHMVYIGDLSFAMFLGNDFKKWILHQNWMSCGGVSATGRNYEETVVALGKKFFKEFGKFDCDDFLTAKEKANHEKERCIIFKEIKDKDFSDGKYRTSKSNPKYINVEISEINRRWLKWFAKTEYGNKNWSFLIKNVLTGKIKEMPS